MTLEVALIPGLKGRECRVVNRNELPTHDTNRLWINSLLDRMDAIAGAKLP